LKPTRSSAMSAVCVAVTLALGACETNTRSGTPRDETPEARPIDHDGWNALGYRWSWTGYPLMSRGALITEAAVLDDMVVTVASDTTLTVLETSTGRVRWARELDRDTTTQIFEPALSGGRLIVTSDTEFSEIDTESGNTIDRDAVGAIINTPPVMIEDIAYMGTTRDELIAFRIGRDFVRWRYRFDGPIGAPALPIDEERVAMISGGGDLRVLNARYGETQMAARIAGGTTTRMLHDGRRIYIASTDQSLYAFDLDEGTRLWRRRTSAPLTAQPVLDDDVLYATTEDTGLTALDAATGRTRWENPQIGGWVVSINGDELVVWNGRDLMLVDARRGDLIATTTLEGVSGVRASAKRGADLYTIDARGVVSKFSPR